jgi:predicted transcriptional regulator
MRTRRSEAEPEWDFHVRLPPKVKQQLEAIAERDRRSLSMVVVLACEDYADNWGDK